MSSSSIHELLESFLEKRGTDLYLTVNSRPMMRGDSSAMQALSEHVIDASAMNEMVRILIGEAGLSEFANALEYNSSYNYQDKGRFRINVFRQKQNSGMVLRRIRSDIPSISELALPKTYADLVLEKRGLVLIVGATGSGKSVSMASMINHRNLQMDGHIVTIEDPIEFIHEPKRCIITQRDVGIDTHSYSLALKNVLRQRPDVIAIGEIRDRETMENALQFSETGHLCLATMHAGNTVQALERALNFFPEEMHRQVLMNLALNLRGVLSQRLIPNLKNKRTLACEIMLNQGVIKNYIQEGRFKEISSMIEKNRDIGMCTFDQSLFELIINQIVDEQVAYAESDNPAGLRLQMTQHGMNDRLNQHAKNAQF